MDPSSNIVPNVMAKKEEGSSNIVPNVKVKKEEGKSQMAGDKRRCKSKGLITNIECLSDRLLFNILLLLSAQDIYDNVRLVCRKWYRMIRNHNFINEHFQHTTCGLLVEHLCDSEHEPEYIIFVAMRQGRIEISKLRYNFGNRAWASCNGLILVSELNNRRNLFIANPVRKQQMALPPFSPEHVYACQVPCIGYAAVSRVYKVVVTYIYEDDDSKVLGCDVLTVGLDTCWRHVRVQHLSRSARQQLCHTTPLITQGFIHWSTNYTHFLTMDVETEIIREVNFSPHVYGDNIGLYCFSTGMFLSLLIACSKLSWEVWEMRPQTGEGTKLPKIDLEAQKNKFKRFGYEYNRGLKPVGWLKYKEVLVLGSFDSCSTFIAYNLCTQEIESFELTSGWNIVNDVHRNSLVSLLPDTPEFYFYSHLSQV